MKHFRTDGEEKQTLIDVGETLVLSRERIRQIETWLAHSRDLSRELASLSIL